VPEAWTAKTNRQYDHMKQSVLERARSEKPASEVAARSISQQRPEAGRNEARRTVGTGNPRAPLEERSRDELYNIAEAHDVKGRSRMNKTQLITAIRRRVGSEL
jgi:Rho termination factor, N-terminal domain